MKFFEDLKYLAMVTFTTLMDHLKSLNDLATFFINIFILIYVFDRAIDIIKGWIFSGEKHEK